MPRWTGFLALFLCTASVWCSRVRIRDNAYSGILVALPRNLEEEERAAVVLNAEAMFRSSSEVLQLTTKGRSRFSDVTFLVPDGWTVPGDDPAWLMTSFNSSSFPVAGAALAADEADLAVAEVGRHPYVLHQGGCGRRAKRMIVPKDFLLGEDGAKGVQLTRLWSEYRYGVFPEGGFEDDEKYPTTYRVPGEDAERTAGCSDKSIWISSSCNEDGRACSENYTSSLMDQHQHSSARLFCEGSVGLGPHHDPASPSKHNLICGEESTWFTVMRNSDFARGRNAAPRSPEKASDVTFRFVRENVVPRVVIAVETSSRMFREHRLLLTKSPFHRFIYSTLPDESEVTLVLFGGDGGVEVVRRRVVLENEESRLHFLESQPLPDDVSETEDVSLEELFKVVFQTMEDGSSDVRTSSADIVVMTTVSHVNATTYEDVKRKIFESESRLHVMLFDEDSGAAESGAATLYDLCRETGGHFTSLHADALLRDMQRGFGNVVRNSNREVLVMQEYLEQDDDVDLEVTFDLDESLAGNLEVYLSLPIADTDVLTYRKTTLRTPSGAYLNFLKMAVLNAWVIQLAKPEAGQYVLRMRRTEENGLPVLITVTGNPSGFEDPITVNVWTESVPSFKAIPAPVRIFVEVRKGWNPVASARVSATVRHPDGRTARQELSDDGLGDVDVTKNDGIYGSYFTRFTDPGYYKVYVEVTGGLNGTQELTGPSHFCCGSFFSHATARAVDSLRREAGPFTFHVPHFDVSSCTNNFPPSRVTDLRMSDVIDRICVLQWTAVGDDYDAGFATSYELKVFRDSAVVRRRFSDSGLEVYAEVVAATPEATYGTPLNHAFQLPASVKGGLYFVAVRAVDNTGNAGEPSNAVPVWIEDPSSKVIDCGSEEEDCENGGCEDTGRAEKLRRNAAGRLMSGVVTFGNIPASAFVPVVSLILSLIVLNAL